MTALYIILGILLFIALIALFFYVRKKKTKKTDDYGSETETRRSFLVLKDKYMLRKEYKILCIVQHCLPPGYFAFPKVGVSNLLEPIGAKVVYEKIKDCFIDIVIFEENTLKPVIAVDVYDNATGDMNLSEESPLLVKSLTDAGIQVVPIKVKIDYTDNDIVDPIRKLLL